MSYSFWLALRTCAGRIARGVIRSVISTASFTGFVWQLAASRQTFKLQDR